MLLITRYSKTTWEAHFELFSSKWDQEKIYFLLVGLQAKQQRILIPASSEYTTLMLGRRVTFLIVRHYSIKDGRQRRY